MCELGAVAGLELWQEVELAAVVEAVVRSTQGNATVGIVAAAERARHEMSWVDRPFAADQA
jgi:hypothetical protein